jgi:hypothetical protein
MSRGTLQPREELLGAPRPRSAPRNRNVFILVTYALSLAADDLWWRAYERDHGHVSLWVYNMCLDFFGHYLAQDGMVIALQATSRTTCQTMLVLVRGRVVCCVVV